MIKQICDWISNKNYSLSEAFKAIDQDFDGHISISDLHHFLVTNLNAKEIVNTKLERLHKIMDVSKSGKIFQSDFEQMFGEIQSKRAMDILSFGTSLKSGSAQSDFSGIVSWQNACIY